MKKTYEKPVLTTEQFDVDDVITASAPGQVTGLGSAHNNFPVDNIPVGDIQFNSSERCFLVPAAVLLLSGWIAHQTKQRNPRISPGVLCFFRTPPPFGASSPQSHKKFIIYKQ